jgi:hypothetical protein
MVYTGDEAAIAKKASEILERSFRNEIKAQNFHHLSSAEAEKITTLSQAITEPRMLKKYPWMMHGIALKMPKHGFVLNYGYKGLRDSHTVKRLKPRKTEYEIKTHPFALKAHPFIDKAVINSGVLDYLAKELPSLKGERILSVMKYTIENGGRIEL